MVAVVEHELKCWPDPFQDTANGLKCYEIRQEWDRTFNVGDLLILREWCPNLSDRATLGPGGMPYSPEERASEANGYTGRRLVVRVTSLSRGPAWELPIGMVVMSIKLGAP